jgi:hypothetical protein
MLLSGEKFFPLFVEQTFIDPNEFGQELIVGRARQFSFRATNPCFETCGAYILLKYKCTSARDRFGVILHSVNEDSGLFGSSNGAIINFTSFRSGNMRCVKTLVSPCLSSTKSAAKGFQAGAVCRICRIPVRPHFGDALLR